MASMETGGAATAIGIWYQSLGAAAALTPNWDFRKGLAPNIHGEALQPYQQPERLRVLLEYFDMDLAITDYSGKWFVQFKVTGQKRPQPFARKEAREVLGNATQAILLHNASTTEAISGFIVASNRPAGKFELIANIANSCRASGMTDAFVAFTNATAPDALFEEESDPNSPQKKKKRASKVNRTKTRTMHSLARGITVSKAAEWHVSVEEATDACLQAMWTLRFAEADPTKLQVSVNSWLSTWGILPNEYERYTIWILGSLQHGSRMKKELSETAIMQDLLGSGAVPLTPKHIWPSIIKDLTRHQLTDPPTRQVIGEHGLPHWLLDRSKLLQGLPDSFIEPAPVVLEEVDTQTIRPATEPRIFALVGDGGVGKSILLRKLFEQIAGTMWDWPSSTLINDGKFLGCPVFREPEPAALYDFPNLLMKWAGRRQVVDDPINRIVHASGVADCKAAIWFGFDGLDEISEDDRSSLARQIANYADSNPKARIVLTCRTDHFRGIQSYLDANHLLKQLPIDLFTSDESIAALFKVTDKNLRLNRQNIQRSEPIALGTRTAMPALAFEASLFDESIRVPLFIGVLRRLYEAQELEIIQKASEGDLDSFKFLASEYLFDSCERIERRINRDYVTRARIFQSIKQLSLDATTPSMATSAVWINICQNHLGNEVQWGKFFSMCMSSGLIRDLKSNGAFEWKLPLVGDYLSSINERASW